MQTVSPSRHHFQPFPSDQYLSQYCDHLIRFHHPTMNFLSKIRKTEMERIIKDTIYQPKMTIGTTQGFSSDLRNGRLHLSNAYSRLVFVRSKPNKIFRFEKLKDLIVLEEIRLHIERLTSSSLPPQYLFHKPAKNPETLKTLHFTTRCPCHVLKGLNTSYNSENKVLPKISPPIVDAKCWLLI